MNKFQSFGGEINPNLSDFKTSFPSLNKDIKTDWLIIGGGLTGLSALNQLKKQNKPQQHINILVQMYHRIY